MGIDIMALNEAIKQESQFVDKVLSEVSKVIVGQREMLEGILMGLLTGGACLTGGLSRVGKDLDHLGHLPVYILGVSKGFNSLPIYFPQTLSGP